MYNFISESKKIQKIAGFPVKNTQYECYKYKRYLSSNPKTVDIFIDIFESHSQEVLVVAPTSAGKTYTANEVFNELNRREKAKVLKPGEKKIQLLNVLLCPNRIQNSQNQKDYIMTALIGNVESLDYLIYEGKNNISAVYDKTREIIDSVINHKDEIKVNLIIDEAHLLVDDASFRNCIEEVKELVDLVLSKGSSVIYITATKDSLKGKSFDKIIEFKDEEYKAPAKKCKIILNASGESMIDFCYKKIKETTLPFVRLNSFSMTDKLLTPTDIIDNRTFLTVDSSKKGATTVYDAKGKEHTVYDSDFFGSVVEKGELPLLTMVNGVQTKVDGYMATSVLQVGTNIKSIGGKQEKSLTPIYICQNPENMSLNATVQFYNRIRFSVDEYVFLMPSTEERKIKSYESIVKKEITLMEKSIKFFSNTIKGLQTLYPKEGVIEGINALLKSDKQIEGHTFNLGHLYLDEETLEVKSNFYKFWNVCYTRYISQYYYNVKEFKKLLEKELHIPVEIIEETEVDKINKEINQKAKDFFKNLNLTADIEKQIKEDDLKDADLKMYARTQIYKKVKELISYDLSVKDAISAAVSTKTKINEIKMQAVRKSIGKIASPSTVGKLMTKEIEVSDMENDLQTSANIIVKNSKFTKYYEFMKNCGLSDDEIIKKYNKITTEKEMNEDMYQERVLFFNREYSNGREWMLAGVCGMQTRAVLDVLYKINSSGNLVQTKITKKIISTIQNTLLDYFGEMYSTSDVLKLIKYSFNTRTDGKDITVLKLKV